MFYREAGQFKASYAADQQIFPIRQDRIAYYTLLAVAFAAVPMVANEYWMATILIPFLVMSIASLGLNILTGYAGQLSLGTGGFMATGAFAAYKLSTWDIGATFGLAEPMHLHMVFVFLGAGVITAAVGVLFGMPSLRIKGFYLAVATLAAQFFLLWLFNKVPWFTNYSTSGVISAPPRELFPGVVITGPMAHPVTKYLFLLSLVVLLALGAKNIMRCHLGRAWMAIRDMDIAAEIIGIRPMRTKLAAFALSSFYCGIAGAAWAFLYTGSVEPLAFSIEVSFKVLFMIIIGGLGSIMGSFLGAAFITLLPVLLTNGPRLLGLNIPVDIISHLEFMIFGALIIFFLIVEPHGLARLWQIAKEKLRLWPFPY
ncbi:branched-chain amino acid ABC transporter permease [Insolitispirillum peregrinum]|uniref:Amino acid/amide ABC transporter membrane protein 2, HAAT family n=1 Tax=Insolitispirillum peregrinum TaxID=80876 RepID=A0A1N7MQS8_9PROT|nr:branched-chain amino acid ABC transporter permease [Insolitispirillum peregrinum]SIS88378.1 amino acid/amide ABC transporter membrane protein 2, HAAT family [Insolitispirillum peregrinum]